MTADVERLERFVRRAGRRRLLVLGPADTGKSYLLEQLAERQTRRGRRVAVIDADVGQSRIGPPTTIGLQVPFRCGCREADAIYFVGSISPPRHLLAMLAGVVALTGRAEREGAELVLVDTPGFAESPAAEALWSSLVDAIEPAVVLVRGGRPDDWRSFGWLDSWPSLLRLAASSQVQPRSMQQRRAYRAEAFESYFGQAGRVRLDLADVTVVPLAGHGGGGVLRARQLVAVRDRRGRDIALGLVLRADADAGELWLQCPVDGSSVATVVGSELMLRPGDWRELPLR